MRAKASQARKVVGVDNLLTHREMASSMCAFDSVYDTYEDAIRALQNSNSHPPLVTILAIPIEAAIDILPDALEASDWVLDVCSVKSSICAAAATHRNASRFIPTHPMAGKSIAGPSTAEGSLFAARPWITLATHPAPNWLLEWMSDVRARHVVLRDPLHHDHLMASVSHGIHLTSLASVLAATASAGLEISLARQVTGPAFRDITRLASSPVEFWVQTLSANREAVVAYLDELTSAVEEIKHALLTADDGEVQRWLTRAAMAHQSWEVPSS